MKWYLLFLIESDHGLIGGWDHFYMAYEDLDDAREKGKIFILNNFNQIDSFKRYQIVDSQSFIKIEDSE